MSIKEIQLRYFEFSAYQWKSEFDTFFYLFDRQGKVDVWHHYRDLSVDKFKSKFFTFFRLFFQQIEIEIGTVI